MECNQEEALRAKETAERKFMAMDMEGAKRYALKAKKLNPRLDGISQMIAILNIHLSSSSSVNGEKDWYSILGIQPSADDQMVKRRYRKFALMLHPDKNKCIGADAAFRLVSEAWTVLSDRARREAYDERRSFKEINRSNTFWTSCKLCRMQYEYLRVYLNHTLLCPNCHEPFLATEIPFPSNCIVPSSFPRNSVNFLRKKVNKSFGCLETRLTSEEVTREDKKGQSRTAKRKNIDRHESDGATSELDIRAMLIMRAKATLKAQLKKRKPKFNRVLAEPYGPGMFKKKEPHGSVSITVPDPEFHDFDLHRSEGCFGVDQVWATYDDEDGMPRLYVMVQKVNSYKPFNIQLSFLNSKSTSEFGPVNWIASGFRKTCGDFRVGRYETRETVNIFSHKVKWEKGPRGTVRILPQKGDVWALYSNWAPDWSELTPDEVLYKYDMVEVMESFTEEEGVKVNVLEKVNGFRTVFRRRLGEDSMRKIPREEMFRLSHQVPYHVITGREKENVPLGCYELDPAAAPPDLSPGISVAAVTC